MTIDTETRFWHLEFTGFSEQEGFYLREFERDIWPGVVEQMWKSECVVIHASRSHKVDMRFMRRYLLPVKGHDSFVEVSKECLGEKKALEGIKYLSFFGGNLNTYMVFSQTEPVLAIVRRYVQCRGICTDPHGLTREDTRQIRAFIAKYPSGHSVISFGHDGDPACIFGSKDALVTLEQGFGSAMV